MSEEEDFAAALSKTIFFPRESFHPEYVVVEFNQLRVYCAFRAVKGAKKIAVFWHGNGETIHDYFGGEFESAMHEQGMSVFFAEYIGYGAYAKGNTQLLSMLDYVDAVHRAVVNHVKSESDVVVYGRSMGSVFAIEYAHRFTCSALILEVALAQCTM